MWYNKKKRKSIISIDDCDIIGVHIRRTDHLEYEKINKVKHLTSRYFSQAMHLYSDSIKHPIFVIVTDDQEWALKNIHQSFKPYFTGAIPSFLRFPVN